MGILLLIIILAAYKLIELIPLASLIGVMFVVVIKTFDWSSFSVIYQSLRYYRQTATTPLLDAICIVLVTVMTVITNLAIAVGCGIVFSSLVYTWKNSQRVNAIIHIREDDNIKVYSIRGTIHSNIYIFYNILSYIESILDILSNNIYSILYREESKVLYSATFRLGALFFASITQFQDLFDPVNDPPVIEVDFKVPTFYYRFHLFVLKTLPPPYTALLHPLCVGI